MSRIRVGPFSAGLIDKPLATIADVKFPMSTIRVASDKPA